MGESIKKLKFAILILLVLLCFCFAIYLHIKGISFKIDSIADMKYAPIYFVIIYVAISFIPIPIAPIMFAGGFIFPFIQAVILTFIGSLIFSVISFYLSRWLGREYYEELESKNTRLKKFDLKFRKDPFENLLLLRLFFLIPGEVVNVYAGLSRIKLADFIKSTSMASIPLIICCIGVVRGRIVHDNVSLYLSILGLIVLICVPLFFKEKIRKHKHLK